MPARTIVGEDFYARMVREKSVAGRRLESGAALVRFLASTASRRYHGPLDIGGVGRLAPHAGASETDWPGATYTRCGASSHRIAVGPDVVNFGIIGCGLIGRKRARALGAHRLLACADPALARAEALAAQFHGCAASTQADEMLSSPPC